MASLQFPLRKPLLYSTYALIGYSVTTFIQTKLFNIHHVTGSSMSPALSPAYAHTRSRDIIFVSGWSTPRFGSLFTPWYVTLRRGDVVALWKPHDSEGRSVKRIVALPGDVVRVRKGVRIEANVRMARKLGFVEVKDEVKVPSGHVWVEGDNWRDSFDSNDYGSVPINLITGRAVGIVWPPARWGKIAERDGREGTRSIVEIRKVIPRQEDDPPFIHG